MELLEGRLALSPSDLSGFCACPHLAQLEHAVARGAAERPVFDDPHAELIRRKGAEHEAAYLARLEAAGMRVLRIPNERGREAEAARLTEAAIRSGAADVIYQARLAHGGWRGFADFLERGPDGGYEPVETKLARTARPAHLLQLCYYAEQIDRIQGRLPARVHVEAGSGRRQSFRTVEFMAYYRRVRARFEHALTAAPATYPWPCDHCSVCVWRRACHGRLAADDHPVLVAGLGRTYVDRLEAAGIKTLERLGDTPPGTVIEGVRPETFDGLRHQAELQLHHRRNGTHRVDHLPLVEHQGFHQLPEPSEGDVWLDLEGHPFFEPARGLEYLFGLCDRDDSGVVRYAAHWGTDHDGERAAFERVVDWIAERRARHPGMHVYHYGDYERATLRRLMGEHGTREDEIDDFLRHGVLVDLHRIVRQALRASVDSYSIKKVEALYGFARTADVSGGAESTVLFERWLECEEPALLQAVERYNEDDCRSTVALHEWLLARRPEGMPWRPAPVTEVPKAEAQEAAAERDRVRDALLERAAGDENAPAWLLAQLLDYHQREARPQWWEWFHRLEMDEDEHIEDSSSIGGLVPIGEPVPEKRSLVYELAYPPQEHKADREYADPATESVYKVEIDDDRCVVRLRRGIHRSQEPLPRALVPKPPINDRAQRDAVLRFARSYLAGDGSWPALIDVLERRAPRADLARPVPEAALTLDGSFLFVQGPPGAGKTWQGARAAVALMREGRRIGVTSLSHKAINHLLRGIEREALAQGFSFRGLKKYSDEEDAHWGRCVESSSENDDFLAPELLLVAGTSWLFARAPMALTVDTLFVDEAGQVSLADAIASGTAARNLVLLGDPNQLPQVSMGAHPAAAKTSVLQHLLGEQKIVPPDRGVFLAQTWRLRPEPCAFTSEAYYEGQLSPGTVCAQRSLDLGNGLFVLPVEHEGRSQSCIEEADAVAAEIRRLVGTPFTENDATTRTLGLDDVLVVAPYNAQVRALRSRLPAGARVGTVDKFQGQEAPVVIVSFASSSGADAPRGIQFAFDRHRVNVATSRAQCRVVLVCAPRLLEAECRTIEQMRLMNAVCRFVEQATPLGGPPTPKFAGAECNIFTA